MQNVNADLVKSLEGLRERRDNIIVDIQKDSERKNEIEQMIQKLQAELENLNMIIDKKIELRADFETSINNTEGAYLKVRNDILIFSS